MNKLEWFGPACLKIIGFLLCAKLRREGFSPKVCMIVANSLQYTLATGVPFMAKT